MKAAASLRISKLKFLLFFSAVFFASLVLRWLYLLSHEDVPQRKEVGTFTGIRFLDRYMLLWPLIAGVIVAKLPWDLRRKMDVQTMKHFSYDLTNQFFSKWALSYLLFLVFFHTFATLSGTKQGSFDPSGHLSCGLLAAGLWIALLNFVTMSGLYEEDIARLVTGVVFGFVSYHAYVVVQSVMIYHDSWESSAGYMFGVIMYIVAIWIDAFSEQVTYLASKVPMIGVKAPNNAVYELIQSAHDDKSLYARQ